MQNQPVPNISENDIRRIVLRDYGETRLTDILARLNECSDSHRVQAAMLKMANADLSTLQEACNIAVGDYRDVLAYAEYPRYMKEVGFKEMDEALRQSIIADDWSQYQDWLNTA